MEWLQQTIKKHKGLWDYCEQLYVNKMDNLEEMDRFLENFNLPRLNQEEIEIMNKPVTSTEIEAVIKFSSVTHSSPTLCNPMDCNTPGISVHHQLPELIQTHIHWISDATQPSHPVSSPSPPAPNPSQHQGLFQWVSSSHQVAKVLEFQLQHQSLQWTPRTYLL